MAQRIPWPLFVALLALVPGGCHSAAAPQPVHGKVFYKERPAEGAVVTFVPLAEDAGGQKYAAVVAADGSYKLSARGTFDGAPAGRYAVTVFYLSPEKKVDGQNAGPDLLGGRYADPKTTPLKVEVKQGDNEIEAFHLK
jgi:hypothetical protein